MNDYYDDLETRASEEREQSLFERLPAQLENAKQKSSAFARSLADVDASAVSDRKALAELPVLRKSELIDLQRKTPPFGALNTTPLRQLGRVFGSPGPIYEPEGKRNDYWRMARALYAAGFRKGDLVHNSFAYHFTPGGWMLDSGARALGCPVFPAGVGQTEQQVEAINDLKSQAYTGTPSFLKILLEKGKELGQDISSLTKALVSGEPLPPSLREEIKQLGVQVLQCYATADLGLIAYESEAIEGMIVDEEIILEIVRPGTGDPVEQDEVGEVVITTFNSDYPLIRFGTGDMSAVLAGVSPCGRTNTRIKGWMGRADQTTKVKGMFVHPGQVAGVIARHPQVKKARLVVDREDVNDVITLQCECADGDDNLKSGIVESIREICKLRGQVAFVEVGSLPNDGKVIDDIRVYQ